MVLATGLSPHERRIAELVAENETLREEVRQLREFMRVPEDAVTVQYVMAFGLTLTEAKVFRAIAERDTAPTQVVRHAVWGHLADPVSDKILPTMVHKVRRKLLPHGIVIDALWNHGYRMGPQAKERVRRFMEDWNNHGRPVHRRVGGTAGDSAVGDGQES